MASGVRWFSMGEGLGLHLIAHEDYRGDPVKTNETVHLVLATDSFDDPSGAARPARCCLRELAR